MPDIKRETYDEADNMIKQANKKQLIKWCCDKNFFGEDKGIFGMNEEEANGLIEDELKERLENFIHEDPDLVIGFLCMMGVKVVIYDERIAENIENKKYDLKEMEEELKEFLRIEYEDLGKEVELGSKVYQEDGRYFVEVFPIGTDEIQAKEIRSKDCVEYLCRHLGGLGGKNWKRIKKYKDGENWIRIFKNGEVEAEVREFEGKIIGYDILKKGQFAKD